MSVQNAEEKVLEAVKEASEKWKEAFNSGNAAGCAAQYEENAVMHARPFGTFQGKYEIQAFWQQLVDGGYSDVEYLEPVIEMIDEQCAVLSSGWKMNKAHGVIHRELWVLQDDGKARLREDDFEAQG